MVEGRGCDFGIVAREIHLLETRKRDFHRFIFRLFWNLGGGRGGEGNDMGGVGELGWYIEMRKNPIVIVLEAEKNTPQ